MTLIRHFHSHLACEPGSDCGVTVTPTGVKPPRAEGSGCLWCCVFCFCCVCLQREEWGNRWVCANTYHLYELKYLHAFAYPSVLGLWCYNHQSLPLCAWVHCVQENVFVIYVHVCSVFEGHVPKLCFRECENALAYIIIVKHANYWNILRKRLW